VRGEAFGFEGVVGIEFRAARGGARQASAVEDRFSFVVYSVPVAFYKPQSRNLGYSKAVQKEGDGIQTRPELLTTSLWV
jgi:hypothetical protein